MHCAGLTMKVDVEKGRKCFTLRLDF